MDVHVGEPKYQCNDCDCKFIRKSDLMAHAEGHTKTWTCKFAGCNKTVTYKRYLNSHYKTHSDEIKYPCLKCDRRFKFNEQRKRHLSTDHWRFNWFLCLYVGFYLYYLTVEMTIIVWSISMHWVVLLRWLMGTVLLGV